MNSDPTIKLQGIQLTYPSAKKVLLQHLNLDLEAGHIYGLLGQNGVGKTTLLKLMAGLIFPDAGNCSVLGHTPSKRESSFLQELFFAPEDFALPSISIRAYQKYYGSFYPRFDQACFKKALALFELTEIMMLNTLSHGQKKLFMMSFAIATRSKLLILDEPTNGLDIPNKQIWQSFLSQEMREDQLILISTHQVHDIEHLIDGVIVMKAGKIILNTPLSRLEEKLYCGVERNTPTLDSVFYMEPRAGGYHIIRQNLGQEASQIDLVLPFNGLIQNAQFAAFCHGGESHVSP